MRAAEADGIDEVRHLDLCSYSQPRCRSAPTHWGRQSARGDDPELLTALLTTELLPRAKRRSGVR